MMTTELPEYFEREDTPMPNSPVGLAMQRLLRANPGMDFEAARAKARENPFRGTMEQAGRTLSPENIAKMQAGRRAVKTAKKAA